MWEGAKGEGGGGRIDWFNENLKFFTEILKFSMKICKFIRNDKKLIENNQFFHILRLSFGLFSSKETTIKQFEQRYTREFLTGNI